MIIVAVIIALPLISLVGWVFQEKKPMGIIIVDKTVPTIDREKHKSFNWIITNNRFVKKEKKTVYSYRKDYYGFFPTRPLKERLWEQKNLRLADILGESGKNGGLANKTDAVYFTDTYGVYFNEWFQGMNRSRRTRKLYGGLNTNDNVLLKTMKDNNKLVILEYNSFDYPTDDLNSFRLQERLGISYSGWTGKYFSSLDTAAKENQAFPIWMTAMYRKQYRKPWTFKNPGIIFIRDKSILVLEEGTTLNKALPEIITDSLYRVKYNLPESVPFNQWFDIIDPMDNNIISRFRIATNHLGDSILNENGLASIFPAAINDPVAKNTFYFSGDFTHYNIPFWTSRFIGIDKLKGIVYSKKPDDTRRFFWLYYKPLIEGIFNDFYSTMPGK
jgi:hypothetical protein